MFVLYKFLFTMSMCISQKMVYNIHMTQFLYIAHIGGKNE